MLHWDTHPGPGQPIDASIPRLANGAAPTKCSRGCRATKRSRAPSNPHSWAAPVQVHVVLGMIAEIAAVILGGHGVERQPAILGLGLVRDQWDAALSRCCITPSKPGSSSMMSWPCAFFSTMPMFFQNLHRQARRRSSSESMCATVFAVQSAPPNPLMENVVAKWKCAGSAAASLWAMSAWVWSLGKIRVVDVDRKNLRKPS